MQNTIDAIDWAFIGTVLASFIALIRGLQAGSKDKKTDPLKPTAPNTYADLELIAQALSGLQGAVLANSAVMKELVEIQKELLHRHEVDEEVQKRLDARQLQLLSDQLKENRRTRGGGEV